MAPFLGVAPATFTPDSIFLPVSIMPVGSVFGPEHRRVVSCPRRFTLWEAVSCF